MAKQEFLENLRVARNLFMHRQVHADTARLDPQAREGWLARSAIWLAPKSVRGFDSDEFGELGSARQRDLAGAIQDFLSVAELVPPTAPADADQIQKAADALTQALTILQPYLPTSEEWRKTEDALKRVDFPSWVASWDYEFGSDQDGEPAVWVTIFADEQSAPRDKLGRVSLELTGKIHNALSAAGIERWPYIRMRMLAEHMTA